MTAKPSALALHFEAKKHAYRQTQDGMVISFVVHPDEVNAELAAAPLGTVYMVALVRVNGDNEPVPASGKEPTPWATMRPSQQAGIRCNDPLFWKWACVANAADAAEYVRGYCLVKSRTELDSGPAEHKWRGLDNAFINSQRPKL